MIKINRHDKQTKLLLSEALKKIELWIKKYALLPVQMPE